MSRWKLPGFWCTSFRGLVTESNLAGISFLSPLWRNRTEHSRKYQSRCRQKGSSFSPLTWIYFRPRVCRGRTKLFPSEIGRRAFKRNFLVSSCSDDSECRQIMWNYWRNSRPMAMTIKKYERWRIYRTNDVVLYLVSILDRKLKLCRISYRLAEVQETLQFCIGRRALCNRQPLYGWLYHLSGVIANRAVHSHFKTVDYKYSFFFYDYYSQFRTQGRVSIIEYCSWTRGILFEILLGPLETSYFFAR